jgi:hypothetical protein
MHCGNLMNGKDDNRMQHQMQSTRHDTEHGTLKKGQQVSRKAELFLLLYHHGKSMDCRHAQRSIRACLWYSDYVEIV